jgi:integrase
MKAPKPKAGTWAWLIARYQTDDFSPFQEIKANTQAAYREDSAVWVKIAGSVLISATDFETLKRWQRQMQADGRSLSYIARKFTMLRIIANYAAALKPRQFGHVKVILSTMRFKRPAPRDVSPTTDQITSIIAAADAAGDKMMALAVSLQWWLTLRAVDVRGHWLNGKWADGLTWEMIEGDMEAIRKVVSKTAGSEPREIVWSLADLPDLQRRLREVRKESGPVILQDNGKPYDKSWFTTKFRRYRDAAGVPATVKMMDTRAGAINHSKRLGATEIEMQHQALHASSATTQRYIRDRSDGVNSIIRLRAGAA